jgi:hypothetical protein
MTGMKIHPRKFCRVLGQEQGSYGLRPEVLAKEWAEGYGTLDPGGDIECIRPGHEFKSNTTIQ